VESSHYGNASYRFTAGSIVEVGFGYLDGALNAFPKGGFLSRCGLNLRAQRYQFLNLTEQVESRDLLGSVFYFYNVVGFTYDVTYNCYYGMTKFVNLGNLEKLWLELDILYNIAFNVGYIYTDLVMIIIGVPGQTEADYLYYLFFYIGDLTFRFFFREDA